MQINWYKCIANGGFAFFTVLIGLSIITTNDLEAKLLVGLFSGFVSFGFAFFREMKDQSDAVSVEVSLKPKKNKTVKIIDHILPI